MTKYMKCFRSDKECQLSQELGELQNVVMQTIRPLLARVAAKDLLTVEAALGHAMSTTFCVERLRRYADTIGKAKK